MIFKSEIKLNCQARWLAGEYAFSPMIEIRMQDEKKELKKGTILIQFWFFQNKGVQTSVCVYHQEKPKLEYYTLRPGHPGFENSIKKAESYDSAFFVFSCLAHNYLFAISLPLP